MIWDERLEMDPSTGKTVLLVRGSAVYKTNFFFLTMIYKYDNGRFVPEKTLLTKSYYMFGIPCPLLYEYDIPDSRETDSGAERAAVPDTGYAGPEVIDGLKAMTVDNLNDPENAEITIPLPGDWHAKRYVMDIASDFEFQSSKNKQKKQDYEYEIYKNEIGADDYNFYTKGIVGRFSMLSYYHEETERARFPNHCAVKSRVFSGRTSLGQGEIFILDCDLPKDERTQKYGTYEEIYAWIPIDNEILAYNLALDVPLNEDSARYVDIMKRMLGVNKND